MRLCCVNMLGNTGRTTSTFVISSTDDLRLMVMRDIIATVILREKKKISPDHPRVIQNLQQFELGSDILNAWGCRRNHDTQNESNRKDDTTKKMLPKMKLGKVNTYL